MKKKITQITVIVMFIFLLTVPKPLQNGKSNPIVTEATFESKTMKIKRNTQLQKKEPPSVVSNKIELHMSSDNAEIDIFSEKDIYLLALITMAEAEGESEKGKRLVIDTVLNRVDSNDFPNTIYEVVYQPNQFSSICNGRADNVKDKIDTDIYRLVREEIHMRCNYDVIYFTAGDYGKYGKPAFPEGNHYFSIKEEEQK